jgi:phosphate transport system permease protein
MSRRVIKDKIFAAVTRLALFLSLGILAFLVLTIAVQGIKAFSLQFFFLPARDFGASGGISYQIIGSLLLVVVAALLVLPFAVGTAIFRSECVKSERLKRGLDMALFCLNSIPSVTYGLFGLILFVNIFNTGISWFVGSIILAIMMLPTVTITSFQAMNSIPDHYRENGFALGLNQIQIIRRIILPQSLHGIVTGILIALARAIGETAPIMFIATAFSGVTVPNSLNEPVATLPTHILALAQQATNPDALQNAWGASFTLIILVMLFSALAYFARLKFKTLAQR